jgi:short subunit dehydrogenase-like uncharacterized protein
MMKVSGISEVPRSLHASAQRLRHRTFADPPPAAPPALQALALTPAFVRSLLALPPAQAFLKALANRQPEGPSDEARCRARAVLVGVARNAKGEAVRTRLTTPEGYTLTARTSLDATMRVAAGEFKPGFQTPSMAFGPDYILGFEGVMREELNA